MNMHGQCKLILHSYLVKHFVLCYGANFKIFLQKWCDVKNREFSL